MVQIDFFLLFHLFLLIIQLFGFGENVDLYKLSRFLVDTDTYTLPGGEDYSIVKIMSKAKLPDSFRDPEFL